MLKKEEIRNPSAIEEYFCKPLDKFVPKQMTKDQMTLMLVIGMAKEEQLPELETDFAKTFWFYPVVGKRIVCFSYTMDTKAKMLLVSWCASVGDAIMYLTYLQYKCKQRNIKALTYDGLAMIFANGVFDRDFMHEIWDKQKVESDGDGGSDNLIDYATAMQSLMF